MTFEQASAEYATLLSEWRAGRVNPGDFHARAAQLRVTDAQGRCWQIDPASGQWLYWTGSAWALPAPAPPAYPAQAHPGYPAQAHPAPAQVPQPRGPGIGEALLSMAPGLLVEFLQRGSLYRTNPAAAVHFAVPALLPAVALALAPRLGRVFAVAVILGSLAWLAWPMIAGPPPANEMMSHAGRGLVGMSMLYMIPRVWTAASRARR